MFFGWGNSPVEMSYTNFSPPPNNLTAFLFAAFGQYLLDL